MNSELRTRILLLGILCGSILILSPTPRMRAVSDSLQAIRRGLQVEQYQEVLDHVQRLRHMYPDQSWFLRLEMDLAIELQREDLVIALIQQSLEHGFSREELDCILIRSRLVSANPREIATQLQAYPASCLTPGQIQHLLDALLAEGELKPALDLAASLRSRTALQPAQYLILGILEAIQQPEQGLASLQLYFDFQVPPEQLAVDLSRAIRQAELEGSEAYSLVQVGRILASHGKWLFAQEAFRNATQRAPEFSEAWAYLGLAMDRSGSNGYPMLARAIRLEDQSPLPHFLMAKHWFQVEHYDLAIRELEKAGALEPDNPAILADLGEAYLAAGNPPEAREQYIQAAHSAGVNLEFWLLLADFSYRTETELMALGVSAARAAWFLDPDAPTVYQAIGYGYLLLGEFDLADRFLRLGLTLEPRNANLQYSYALLQLVEGDLHAARAALEFAISLDPQGSSGWLAKRTLDRLSEN